MGVLLDTNILIEYERQRFDLAPFIHDRATESVCISVVSASELLHGVQRALTPAGRARRQAFVEAILDRLPVLPIDLAVARVHADLWSRLTKKGSMIGLHDSWLAATCLVHGFSVVTLNRREFLRVPGLKVETWR